MLPDLTQGMRRPLFFKLALIFLVTSVTVVSSVGAFFYFERPHDPRHRDSFRRNTIFYVHTLMDRIGNPPTAAKAEALSGQLALGMRVEGPGLNWSSSPDVPQLGDFEDGEGPNDIPDIRMGHVGKLGSSLAERGPWHYLFVFPGRPLFTPPLRKILIQLLVISMVLVLSFLAVKWLLRPINLLVGGVSEISAGNLNYEIQLPGGHGEFKDLAEAFNGMTAKVRSMIHAKERLLIDVSHELRSPLARMKVALEMMPKGANQQAISRAATEMEIMLSEILETERLKSSHGALHKTALSLPELATRLARNYRNSRPGLKILRPKASAEIMADESQCSTVLKNIFENSLKYSAEQKRPVEVSFSEDAAALRVMVRDFGIGIPNADLPLVFEPFYRVDKSRTKKTGGYGLGLSLCKEIMHAHGGEILIQSPPQAGTEVTLLFPKN